MKARHAVNDVAEAAPVVEAAVQALKLWLARFKREEAEGGVK